MNTHDAARSTFGMMSVWVRSMPVSISPTRAPFPLFTAYDPAVVAPIARMSHWHAPNGSGPIDVGTLKSVAHAAFSAACVLVPGGAASTLVATRRAATVAAKAAREIVLRICGYLSVVGWSA